MDPQIISLFQCVFTFDKFAVLFKYPQNISALVVVVWNEYHNQILSCHKAEMHEGTTSITLNIIYKYIPLVIYIQL